jgi:lipopolysaccharide assembly outer membrane protein LptD (OstA)
MFCLLIGTVPLFCSGMLLAAQRSVKRNPELSQKQVVPVATQSETGELKSTVVYAAKDSVIYNLDSRNMELWGKARIDQEGSSVKAPKIIVDLDSSLFHAFGNADSLKAPLEPAVFTDRQGSFNAETMTYNFKTKKGETTNVLSSTNHIFFGGEHVTRLENGEMIIKDGTFTSCDDPSPHYWFSSSQMTIIPGNRITAHPFFMYIEPEIFSRRLPAIPILALPYMVFPLKDGRSSGFLMPSIGNNSDTGYSLSNLGYFWAINDYMDLKFNGDISVNGSWRLGERYRYKNSNIFSGEISGEYKDYQRYSDWNAKFIHNQVFDSSTRLDVNMQLQGPPQGYDLNSNNSIAMVTQQSNARAALAKTFNDENSIAAITYNRSEDLSTLDATQTFDASFYQNRMYPFRSTSSADDWRSNVSLSSAASFSGTTTSQSVATSSGYAANANVEMGYYREFSEGSKALFTQGVSLQATQPVSGLYTYASSGTNVLFPLRMQSTVFRYFNVNPSLTFVHSLYADETNKDVSTTVFAVDASTRLYGTLETGFLENLFGLNALRHTFIPTISYLWNPSFSGSAYNYYGGVYDWTDSQLFGRLNNTIYAGVPEGQSAVGITLKNLIQGKVRGSASSGEDGYSVGDQTVQLLAVNAATAYNFNADALHLAPLTLTAYSNALASNLLFSGGAMYDIYSYDLLTGKRINRLNSDDGGGLFRFIKGFLNMSLSIQGSNEADSSAFPSVSTPSPLFVPNASQSIFLDRFNTDYFRSIDYRQPWQVQVSLFLQSDRSNPLLPVTTSLINASVKELLSKEWQMVVNTGYDVQNNQFVFPMLQLNRDLHCWQMSFQWIPFGQFRSYAIQIGLKAPWSDFNVRTGKGTTY